MAETIQAFPLDWPKGQKRTPAFRQERGNFKDKRGEVIKELLAEIGRMGGSKIVISSNVETKRDGTPYANRSEPYDSGVAVYFVRNGRPICFPCDKYERVTANLRAVSKTIEALRGIERWGGVELMDKAFSGFMALPPPIQGRAPWYEILGVPFDASADAIRAAKIALNQKYHPDKTGGCKESESKLMEINAAAQEGMKLRGMGQ